MPLNVESDIRLSDVNQNNVGHLRLLNSVLFPMKYDQKFYSEILKAGEFAKVVYFGETVASQDPSFPIGAVCCRKEKLRQDPLVTTTSTNVETIGPQVSTTTSSSNEPIFHRVYLMTLGVLAPYRRLGIGSCILRHILDQCTKDSSIRDIYLHVQVNNAEALRFYEKFGFQIIRLVPNYYRTIDPPDAYELCKTIHDDSFNQIHE